MASQSVVKRDPAVPAVSSAQRDVLGAISAVRDVFSNHFDRNWLVLAIGELPLDPWTMRDIRDLVAFKSLFPGDEYHLVRGVRELERLVYALRRYLVPQIKEKLGVSGFSPRGMCDREQYVLRRFVAITFAHNVALLEKLTRTLKGAIFGHFPHAALSTPWRSEDGFVAARG